jgi:hypothetical protein
MKITITLILGFFILMGDVSLTAAKGLTAADANEARFLRFAEQLIIIELTRGLSHSVRQARERCPGTCLETEATELVIGLIGANRSGAAADALVNLLGLRLDGAGSEELGCQIVTRGTALLSRLANLQAKSVAEHCQSIFHELKKRELRDITDVEVEQICRTEAEILKSKDEFLKAIKSKRDCGLW